MGRFEPLSTDPYQRPPGQSGHYGAICAACREDTRLGTKFCTSCNALRDDAERGHTVRYASSRWMRLWARLLDTLIVVALGMAVFFILDGAGFIDVEVENASDISVSDLNVSTLIATGIWFLWFALVAPKGQTPGKQILRMQIISADGSDLPTSRNWLREGAFQFFLIIPSLLAEPIVSPPEGIVQLLSFAPFITLVDIAFIWAGPDKQTIHDRIFGTLVVSIRPVRQTSAELRAL